MVRVAVKGHCHRVAIERFFEPAGTEEWKYLDRLTLNGPLDGRVVQNSDTLRRAQLDQRRLQLERFLDGFVYKAFDHVFTPRLQSPIAEATCETLDASKSYIEHFASIAIQYLNAGIFEHMPNLDL